MYIFFIIRVYFFYDGTAKETCDFQFKGTIFSPVLSQAILFCKSPTADEIIQSRERLEKNNISGITTLCMDYCDITKISSETFDFHTFVNIQYLSMRENRIISLPEGLFIIIFQPRRVGIYRISGSAWCFLAVNTAFWLYLRRLLRNNPENCETPSPCQTLSSCLRATRATLWRRLKVSFS